MGPGTDSAPRNPRADGRHQAPQGRWHWLPFCPFALRVVASCPQACILAAKVCGAGTGQGSCAEGGETATMAPPRPERTSWADEPSALRFRCKLCDRTDDSAALLLQPRRGSQRDSLV